MLSLRRTQAGGDSQGEENKYPSPMASSRQLGAFHPEETVMVWNYRQGSECLKGIVLYQTGPLLYLVKVGDSTWRRHVELITSTEVQISRDAPDHSGATGGA